MLSSVWARAGCITATITVRLSSKNAREYKLVLGRV